MDDSGQRENGRLKHDHYTGVQWMTPQHPMDYHSMKLRQIMVERDNAIQERNMALTEKKKALAERDMAILQRDAAINERNSALNERDNAIAALEYPRGENVMNGGGGPTCPPGCGVPPGTKHMHHPLPPPPPHLVDTSYHTRDIHVSEAFPISTAYETPTVKPRRPKRPRKENKAQVVVPVSVSMPVPVPVPVPVPSKKKASRKSKRGGEDLNKQLSGAKEDLNKQLVVTKHEWKGQDLGLNQVTFDDSTMPVPVCSCTGVLQQCYKWGNGGWQSACCTTTMSKYPLPVMPNKRHARIGGRKMSGSAFTKLLSRLAAEGHDLSTPLDLKDHWSKHGTNRYITIK